jgi:hypothetical protein
VTLIFSIGTCDIDFLDLLEKEEADFAEQIRHQKSFLQSVFKDKEDLAQARLYYSLTPEGHS